MAGTGARYSIVTSTKWTDPWYLRLKPQQRNLFDYFVETGENNCAGVYQCDLAVARMKTGPWTAKRWEAALAALAGHVNFYGEYGEWVWVVNYLRHNGLQSRRRLSCDVAAGVLSILSLSPLELVAEFDKKYGTEMTEAGHPLDTLSRGSGDPRQIPSLSLPILTLPNHTIPPRAKAPAGKVNGLSPEQQADRGELLAYYRKRQAKHLGVDATEVEFPDGQAAKFFGKRLKTHANSKEALISTIDWFFERWIKPQGGGNFGHYQRAFNGLMAAVERESV